MLEQLFDVVNFIRFLASERVRARIHTHEHKNIIITQWKDLLWQSKPLMWLTKLDFEQKHIHMQTSTYKPKNTIKTQC